MKLAAEIILPLAVLIIGGIANIRISNQQRRMERRHNIERLEREVLDGGPRNPGIGKPERR